MDEKYSIAISRENYIKLADEEFTYNLKIIVEKSNETPLKFEEKIFLLILTLLNQPKKHPEVHQIYNRFMLTLTHYLQSIYGEKYHLRLQKT